MDKVLIRDLEVGAVIGVYDWEQAMVQPLRFDLDMDWDLTEAGRTDDLQYALNYASVSDHIKEFCQQHQFALIERLADALCESLIQTFGLESLSMTLKKPNAVPGCRYVAIQLQRTRGHYG